MQQQSARALGSRYVLERVLGSGAMGQVWLATDQRSGEQVAAKLLRAELVSEPDIVTRFIQERSILLTLTHPHIVRTRDLVVEGDDLALVMDLVTGSDLRRYLRDKGTLTASEAVRIVGDVLDALAAAHAHNVLHRDVKPDNVLLDTTEPPFVRLSDFGIARIAQETTVRMTGVLGTAEYISPEVFTSDTVSPATDVYAAGIVLYELLSGRSPFAGGSSSYAVAHRHVNAAPPPLIGLPTPLTECLDAMLAKDPTARPSAVEASARLRGLAPSLAGVAALEQQPPPATWADSDHGHGTEDGSIPTAPPAIGVAGAQAPNPRDLDPQRTSIRGERRAPTPAGPLAGGRAPQPLLVGSTTESGPIDGTQLQPQRRAPHGPVDVPASPALTVAPSHRRRNALIAAVAVVVVAGGVVGGVALTRGGGGGGATTTPSPLASGAETTSTSVVTARTGLQIQRTATYNPQSHLLDVTVKYSTDGPRLRGPFVEAIPVYASGATTVAAGVGCATLSTADGDPVLAKIPQLDNFCAFRVRMAQPIARGAGQSVTYSVPFPASGSFGDDATNYLAQIAAATSHALREDSIDETYAAQRLVGLAVRAPSTVYAGELQVNVHPVWLGSSQTDPQYVYRSADPGVNPLTARVSQRPVRLSIPPTPSCENVTLRKLSGDTYAIENPGEMQSCRLVAQLGKVKGSADITIDLKNVNR